VTYANRSWEIDTFHLGNMFIECTLRRWQPCENHVAFGLIIITNELLVLGMWSLAWIQ
jgi:hypothetical protein